MDGRAEEEKEGKGLGVLPPHQAVDCGQTQSRASGEKQRSARKRKAKAKATQRDGVCQRKTQAGLQKVLLQTPGGHFKTPKRILPKPLGPHSRQAEGVQAETGSREMGPPASVGGGVSAGERWDVQWQLQRRLDECRRRSMVDIPFHYTVYAVVGKADVVVPPEPFPFRRQALDTAIELL